MSDTAIHIALCFHDPGGTYARHAGATLASVFAGASQPVCAHILHDDTLTMENRLKLIQLADHFRQTILFYPVRQVDYYRDKSPAPAISIGTMYRLLLPELLSLEKVIYLDCDVIVNLDIAELWDIPITDHPVAAVPDQVITSWPPELCLSIRSCQINSDRYFNAGIMIMNLEQIRKQHRLLDEWIRFVQQFPQTIFLDQDILNKLFQTRCLWLDAKYNRFAGWDHPPIDEVSKTPAIWHFAGNKPWNQHVSAVDLLYWRSLALTPWGEDVLEEAVRVMDETFKILTRTMDSEIREIKNSTSWRLTEPIRWIATKLRGQ